MSAEACPLAPPPKTTFALFVCYSNCTWKAGAKISFNGIDLSPEIGLVGQYMIAVDGIA
jgi:hypothetical protein